MRKRKERAIHSDRGRRGRGRGHMKKRGKETGRGQIDGDRILGANAGAED